MCFYIVSLPRYNEILVEKSVANISYLTSIRVRVCVVHRLLPYLCVNELYLMKHLMCMISKARVFNLVAAFFT